MIGAIKAPLNQPKVTLHRIGGNVSAILHPRIFLAAMGNDVVLGKIIVQEVVYGGLICLDVCSFLDMGLHDGLDIVESHSFNMKGSNPSTVLATFHQRHNRT